MKRMKPNLQRSKNIIAILYVIFIVNVLEFVVRLFGYSLLKSFISGKSFSFEEMAAAGAIGEAVNIIWLVLYVISVVFFILWFRRAYYNLHQKLSYLSYSEGWAAGSWFVPFINLWRPFKIMVELYQETKEFLEKNGIEVGGISVTFVAVWWMLIIFSGIFAAYIIQSSKRIWTFDDVANVALAEVVYSFVEIVLTIVTLKVIKDYAKMERMLQEISDGEPTESHGESLQA